MKRSTALWLGALLCVCLAGCAQPAPEKAADGAAWSEDWVTVGNVIGVDTPGGLELQENNDTLAQKGMYYAAWSISGETPFVNADGDDATVYDAQICLLLAGHDSAEKAQAQAAELLDMARSMYTVEDTAEAVYNGQSFTVITHTYRSETNPYQRGASAFGVYRNYAVNVEISCREEFTGGVQEILADFLEHCHYST